MIWIGLLGKFVCLFEYGIMVKILSIGIITCSLTFTLHSPTFPLNPTTYNKTLAAITVGRHKVEKIIVMLWISSRHSYCDLYQIPYLINIRNEYWSSSRHCFIFAKEFLGFMWKVVLSS